MGGESAPEEHHEAIIAVLLVCHLLLDDFLDLEIDEVVLLGAVRVVLREGVSAGYGYAGALHTTAHTFKRIALTSACLPFLINQRGLSGMLLIL